MPEDKKGGCPIEQNKQLIVLSNDFMQRGSGFFKFNNSLLNDKCFVEGLRKKKYLSTKENTTIWRTKGSIGMR